MKDTSRGGRYHNRRYKRLAEEFGLTLTETPPIGWSGTTVPEVTIQRYRQAIEDLDEALVLWRVAEQSDAGKTKSRNLLACSCACPRRIRVAQRTLDQAPILCAACDTAFEPDELDA